MIFSKDCRALGYIHTVPYRTNFRPDILFTRNRAKVSFCSDGTDNRMKFVTLVSGFTISSCTQRFFSKWRPEREKPIRMVARITNISLGRMRRQHYCLMLLYHIKMRKRARGKNGNRYEQGMRNYKNFSLKAIQTTMNSK